MKKLIVGLAFAGSLLAHAQEKTKSASPVTFGVKAGLNVSNLTQSEGFYEGDQKMKAGFNAGIFVNIPVAEKLSIQPEVVFNQLGSKTELQYETFFNSNSYSWEYNYKTSLNYLSVPVMVQYNILPQLFVEAGPEFGFLLGGREKGDVTTSGNTMAKEKISFSNKINTEFYHKFNFGIGIGAGYYFTKNIAATARFTAGITNIYKYKTENAIRNNVFQVGLAYRFK
ncbi:porin family protein [Chryseobacterium sp. 52]|uniref:porin family protein n=1 Tax=Chryseobacterium sp. 52 TaxID=2035213 RepID=UPI000C1921B0|nr:porin family protein [Chryseobacterium sp. 52]